MILPFLRQYVAQPSRRPLVALALVLWSVSPVLAADEPDLIFRRSTVFKLLTPNDKLATYGIDDPEVEGVACHFTVPEKGGIKGWLGLAEEVSDISLALRYRPGLFGRPFSELLQEVMKGPSEWTEAERELFAAFVSLREQCPF